MKGIARVVNSLSRLGGRGEIFHGGTRVSSSSSSLMVSRRSLFISAATQFPTNLPDSPHTSLRSLSLPQKLASFGAWQKRTTFIQTQSTPNPSLLMFYPGKPVMEVRSADFPNEHSTLGSPLAKSIYAIDDFSTVTKSDDVSYEFNPPPSGSCEAIVLLMKSTHREELHHQIMTPKGIYEPCGIISSLLSSVICAKISYISSVHHQHPYGEPAAMFQAMDIWEKSYIMHTLRESEERGH